MTKPVRCLLHKKNEDVPFGYKQCEIKNCKLVPRFAATNGDVAVRCSKHKLENWIDVSHTSMMCKFDGCTLQASFGVDVIMYCSNHKSENDVDLKHPVCIHPGCTIQSTFGIRDGKYMYCSKHKEETNISLKSMKYGDLHRCIYKTFCSVKGKDKRDNRIFDLTMDFLYDLYEKQNKQCYYCASTLNVENMNKTTFDQLSIDRMDSSLGHIQTNCVLSCFFCNYSKTDSSIEEFRLFLDFIRDPTKIHPPMTNTTNWQSTLFSRAKNKNKETDITKEWFDEQYKKQDGKCFYTSVKMIDTKTNRYLFKPSIERVDCKEKYTTENTVLVCLGTNLGRSNLPLDDYLAYIQKLRGVI